jgi:uncharacterized protein with HEPN domain
MSTDERALADLRRFAATARRIAARGREAFLDPDDEIPRLAARTVVINTSAALDRLSPTFRERFPDVPWASIRATRNFIAHAYDDVNDRIVWSAIAREIPDLVARLTATDDGAAGSD